MNYLWLALGWVSTNAVALAAGGYLGYRFGAPVQALVVKLLGLLVKKA